MTWAELFAGDQLPPLPPALPKLIDVTISQTPDLLKGTVAQVVPVAYSIYPRGLSFVYNDHRKRELRMNCLLVAKEGGGKECVTLPIKHILADIKARDKRNRKRLKEFNDRYNRARSDEEKPQRPADLDIQSKAILSVVETDANGVFTLDALKKAYEKVGKEPVERKVKNAINQWKCRGYIVTVTNDSYKKKA